MYNWDDIRFFLSVARNGSVRSASSKLDVNHSTVLRRIANLEDALGARLFMKRPSGYELTSAGLEIFDMAERIEENSSALQKKVFARDQKLTGKLKIALPPSLVTSLLMPDISKFSKKHPEIEISILTSYDTVNLTKGQADVAIRLVYDRNDLPLNLYGSALQDMHRALYISKRNYADLQSGMTSKLKMILKDGEDRASDWITKHSEDIDDIPLFVSDVSVQLEAVKSDVGLAVLPCFIGDIEEKLMRIPNCPTKYYGTIWVLSHSETRKAKRVRLFLDHIKQSLAGHSHLLSGQRDDGLFQE